MAAGLFTSMERQGLLIGRMNKLGLFSQKMTENMLELQEEKASGHPHFEHGQNIALQYGGMCKEQELIPLSTTNAQ